MHDRRAMYEKVFEIASELWREAQGWQRAFRVRFSNKVQGAFEYESLLSVNAISAPYFSLLIGGHQL